MPKRTLRSFLALAGILVGIGGCSDAPTAAPTVGDLTLLRAPASAAFSLSGQGSLEVSAVIGSEGGVLANANGQRLVFPAGALSEPTRITMTPSSEYLGVDLEPHGLRFPTHARPTLTLPLSGIEPRHTRLWIVYVERENILEVLPTAQPGGTAISARLPHFSTYATGRYVGAE
jgi:hypothetical protein